ncbi:InlB B-repeat-containing protein [uncultured Treponema sp.]|uniref:InlB B-repeat-containing protein n=1 Tax=uncultured Treponema sp. TaxID=162155 RepID=UPI0025F1D1A5|nr:InlB B-repeat-containing protein [uncultured Treponema sp.]
MRKCFLMLAFAAMISLVSCGNGIRETGEESSDGGTYLVIRSALLARSLNPTANPADDVNRLENFVLKGTREGNDEITLAGGTTPIADLETLQDTKIPIQVGNWSFTLTAFLDGLEFSGNTESTIKSGVENAISFEMSSVKNVGGMSITVNFDDPDKNIRLVTATLMDAAQTRELDKVSFDWSSIRVTQVSDNNSDPNGSGINTSDPDPSDPTPQTEKYIYSVTYTRSAVDDAVPLESGSYYLLFNFYAEGTGDGTGEATDTPLTPIDYIVRVAKGFTTTAEQTIKLDETYNITYNFNDEDDEDHPAEFEGGEVGPGKYSRKSGAINLPQLEREGYVFAGWYTNNDLTEKIEEIPAGSTGDIELWAKWYEKEAGSVSIDNRVLVIDLSANTLYLNSEIEISAKDANGNPVEDEVTYDAQILYHGNDIGKSYYSLEGNKLTLSRTKVFNRPGTYQLYVTATQPVNKEHATTVTSSQTFDVTIYNEYATPSTNVALYNGSNYYLREFEYIGTADDFETADLSGNSTGCFAFDADGNLYTKGYKIIKSTKEGFPSTKEGFPADGVSCDEDVSEITVDIAKNVLYGYDIYETRIDLYKYANLISSSNAACSTYTVTATVDEEDFYPFVAAVDNETLYAFGYIELSGEKYWYLLTFELNSANSDGSITSAKTSTQFTETEIINSYSESYTYMFTDMLVQEGCAYILMNYSGFESEKLSFNSRGGVIKIDPSKDSANDLLGLVDSALNGSDDYIYAYFADGNTVPSNKYYADAEKSTSPVLFNCSDIKKTSTYIEQGNEVTKTNSFGIYAPATANYDKSFYGPLRFVALNPKKLVISDEGYAFYTDSLGAYKYKNVNRVVTIDLEKFAIVTEEINDVKATFKSDSTSNVPNTCSYSFDEASLYIYNDDDNEYLDITSDELKSTYASLYYSSSGSTATSSVFSNNVISPSIPHGTGND